MKFLEKLRQDRIAGKKNIAILLDPEKLKIETLDDLCEKILNSIATFLLIGGSYIEKNSIDFWILELKKRIKLPIIIFPGHPSQISNLADGILFLSLISGRNVDFLIDHHIDSVTLLEKTQLEIIPTSYLLIGKNNKSSVSRISQTNPMNEENIDLIVKTSQAGAYLGHQLTYLEAGSGATFSVPFEIVKKVKEKIENPIIVGGGIQSLIEVKHFFEAGADIVVIGNSFENNLNFFKS